ncbi:MAG: cytochrome c [Myxococcales bacterium]|nr:cytochrome c [Myxococcales bacterium]
MPRQVTPSMSSIRDVAMGKWNRFEFGLLRNSFDTVKMLGLVLALSALGCSAEPAADAPIGFDGGGADVAMVDGGVSDGGSGGDTSGAPDAGSTDAGLSDAGTEDVGTSSSADTQVPEEDAGPQDVFPLNPGSPVKAITEKVSAGPWTFAAPSHGDVNLAVNSKGEVKLVGPLKGQVDPIVGGASKPTEVIRFGGMVYLADATGLRGILSGKLKLSPLAEFLPKKPITVMRARKTAAGDDLWLVVGDALLLYRGGKLFTVTAPKMQVAGAHLTFGGDVEGGPALWVGGKGGLHAIKVTGGKVTAWPYLLGRKVDGVHVDAKGRVWAASKGELLRRDAPGQWTTHVPKHGPKAIWGRPGDAAFWVATETMLLRWEAGELHEVQGAPAVADWRIDAAGRLTGLDLKGALVRVQTTKPVAKPKVTWKGDIAPLFDNSCAQCHGIDGVNTKLHSSALWKKNFANILKNVESGAMPLSPKQPLTPGEIALIKAWKSDGFKESP